MKQLISSLVPLSFFLLVRHFLGDQITCSWCGIIIEVGKFLPRSRSFVVVFATLIPLQLENPFLETIYVALV